MLLHALFLLGISVEAITGAIAAGRKKMDFFGVLLIACITALGGGTLRDVVLNHHPISWVAHPYYLVLTASCAVLTILFSPYVARILKVFLILDALGLATFTIIGMQTAMALSLPNIVVVISAMVTGISGGMLRDILCNDIPLVLRRELYAVLAFAGAVVFLLLQALGLNTEVNVIITIAFIFITRVLAIHYRIEMPKFDYQEGPYG